MNDWSSLSPREASIASRARELAELAHMLEEAEHGLARLSAERRNSPEGRSLTRRIHAAREEMETIRRGQIWPAKEIGSKRIDLG